MVFHENGEDEEENVLCCHHGFHGETVMERLPRRKDRLCLSPQFWKSLLRICSLSLLTHTPFSCVF